MRTLNVGPFGVRGSGLRKGKALLLLATLAMGVAAACGFGLLVPTRSALAEDPPGGQGPPEITDFVGENVFSNLWDFTGKVINCSPISGLTVTFGGLAEGYTEKTASDGTFLLTVEIPSGSNGWVTAQVKAADGQTSQMVFWLIQD